MKLLETLEVHTKGAEPTQRSPVNNGQFLLVWAGLFCRTLLLAFLNADSKVSIFTFLMLSISLQLKRFSLSQAAQEAFF